MSWVPLMVCAGPTPSEEALERCHEVLLRADGDKKTMGEFAHGTGSVGSRSGQL